MILASIIIENVSPESVTYNRALGVAPFGEGVARGMWHLKCVLIWRMKWGGISIWESIVSSRNSRLSL